jgi:hypothetical protein
MKHAALTAFFGKYAPKGSFSSSSAGSEAKKEEEKPKCG